MQFARDLDTSLANRFVSMYVNDRTLDYGADGREAIRKLLEVGHETRRDPHQAPGRFCRLSPLAWSASRPADAPRRFQKELILPKISIASASSILTSADASLIEVYGCPRRPVPTILLASHDPSLLASLSLS